MKEKDLIKRKIKGLLEELIHCVKMSKYNEVYDILNSVELNKYEKGLLFECFLQKLFIGNGWICQRVGGTNDEGADLLLYHPSNSEQVLYVIQSKNYSKKLNYKQTISEITMFEKGLKQKYKCTNYRIVSINGYVKSVDKLKKYNISFWGWNEIVKLMMDYNDQTNQDHPFIGIFPLNENIVDEVFRLWKFKNKVAVVQPTGTGKTYIIEKIIGDKFYLQKSIIVTPNNLIIDYMRSTPYFWVLENTIFLTYYKLSNMSIAEIKKLQPQLIIFDELHRCGAIKWGQGVKRLLECYPEAKVLGTTATPVRTLDNARDMVEEICDNNIASFITLSQAIVTEMLKMPIYVCGLYNLDDTITGVESRLEKNTMNAEDKLRTKGILEEMKKNWEENATPSKLLERYLGIKEGKCIIFCKDQKQLKVMKYTVSKWFNDININTHIEEVSCEHKESRNRKVLKRFEKSEPKNVINLLFCIDMLNEGVHVSGIDFVIFLRKTKSDIVYFQQLGRVLDSKKEKLPIVFDLVDNVDNIQIGNLLREIREEAFKYQARRKADELSSDVINLEQIEACMHDETKDVIIALRNIEMKFQQIWSFWINLLRDYCEEYGNCDVPIAYKTKDGYKLGQWVSDQRKRKLLLSDKQRKMLEDLGFKWDILDDKWREKINLLKEYKEEYGDCNVPGNYVTRSGVKLGGFVVNTRQKKRYGKLSEEKVKELDDLGFIWNIDAYNWQKGYEAFKKFKNKYGHCNVPLRGIIIDGVNVGSWVVNQRQDRKNNKLSKERIELLDELGMIWNTNDQRWEMKCKLLEEFKRKNGHCNVPSNYITEDGVKLGYWVGTQRQDKKKGRLSEYRRKRLDEIGMIW